MTLGVTNSAQADRDIVFSQRLRLNAHSLELKSLMSASKDWDYGQGIRKAVGESYFWELSSEDFLPLGLNHPLFLKNLDTQTPVEIVARHFPTFLNSKFLELKDWTWNLLASEQVNELKITNNCFEEDATIKCQNSWIGFTKLRDHDYWIVKINNELSWVASSKLLPLSTISSPEIRAVFNLFFTEDIMGEGGRVQELNSKLQALFPEFQVEGLNVFINGKSANDLSLKGISCDDLGDKEIRLCFPTSVLQADLEGIREIISQ
ncbi:MAG: hypothetical protein K2P81_12615 [Bacteriovoracaceae bacterium]|nr:hypothetical protein [Bacteriovoracaceae bacterium]